MSHSFIQNSVSFTSSMNDLRQSGRRLQAAGNRNCSLFRRNHWRRV